MTASVAVAVAVSAIASSFVDSAYITTTNGSGDNRPRRAAVTAAAFERLRETAPAGVEVVAIDDGLDLESIDFLVPASSDGQAFEALPELTRVEVVQVLSAGTDQVVGRMPPQATLCSARGARDGPVAEWAVAALLGATSRTLECAPSATWTDREVEDLESWTVLVVGMGSIGRRVARLLEPFGTRVVGVASRAREDVHGVDDLPDLLPEADAVVLLTPLTDATRGLIGAAELARVGHRAGTPDVPAAGGGGRDRGRRRRDARNRRSLRLRRDATLGGRAQPRGEALAPRRLLTAALELGARRRRGAPPGGALAADRRDQRAADPTRPRLPGRLPAAAARRPHEAAAAQPLGEPVDDRAVTRPARFRRGARVEPERGGKQNVEGKKAKGDVDRLRFGPTSVRFLRIRVTAATKGIEGDEESPLLQELTASG